MTTEKTEMVVVDSRLPEIAHQTTPMTLLEKAMTMDGIGLDKLEALFDLQVKYEQNEARKAYHVDMAAFKAEPVTILKDKKVEYNKVKYSHPTLGGCVEAIGPALSRHNLSATWNVDQSNGVTVTCTITHAMGHSESVTMTAAPDSSGQKNQIQQVASAMTYLQRYTLLAVAGQAAMDVDDDGQSAYQQQQPQAPPQQQTQPPPKQATYQDYIEGCDYFLEKGKSVEAFDTWLSNKQPGIDQSPESEKINSYAAQIKQAIIDNQPATQGDIPL